MDVVLFHHARGLTEGVRAFAGHLTQAGHTVHTPDLFDGRTFDTMSDGLAHVEALGGFESVIARAEDAVRVLPAGVAYAGFSLGVPSAQKLAQTRPGTRGALLYHSCVPVELFGAWPPGLPVQIHGMDRDPYFVDEGDIDAARRLMAANDRAELYLYPGDQHCFADPTLASYRPEAAALLLERSLAFLRALEAPVPER